MPTYNPHKFNGADNSFNRTWTLITTEGATKKNAWVFLCGCGTEQEFTPKDYLEPQEAAITFREFHRCAIDEAPGLNNNWGE